jgi:hypothetical protein
MTVDHPSMDRNRKHDERADPGDKDNADAACRHKAAEHRAHGKACQ